MFLNSSVDTSYSTRTVTVETLIHQNTNYKTTVSYYPAVRKHPFTVHLQLQLNHPSGITQTVLDSLAQKGIK